MEIREHHPAANEAISEQCQAPQTPRKKDKNKRRFTDDQIRLLESIFESETRLEPRKKLQVARELGLQPRQVAIWFQNRRARLKSKQIEKDYIALRDNYDKLASRFESLKKEKQSLISQMQKLSEMLAETHDMHKVSKIGLEPEAEAEPSFRQALMEDKGFLGLEIEKDHRDIEHAMQHGEEFMSMDEYRNDQFPASPEKLYGFDSADMLCGRPQWLNF